MKPKNKMKNYAWLFLFFFVIIMSNSFGQEKNYFNKTCLGIEIGTWKPYKLQTTKTPYAFSLSKENLYLGSYLIIPIKSNFSFRITIGYYNFIEDNYSSFKKSIILIPILFDVKYMLVSGSKISPYVSYGFGTCIGRQKIAQIFSSKLNKDSLGYGINFGTGFDFLIFKHLTFGLEFKYHYLKFSKVFIFTNDYSGPKVNMTLYYLF